MSEKSTAGFYSCDEPGRMIYATLLKPRKYKNPKTKKEEGEAKFSASLAYPKDSDAYKAIKRHMNAVAKAEFGDDVDLKAVNFPRKDGDKIADKRTKAQAKGSDDVRSEAMRGMYVIKASSKYRPKLAFIENGKIVEIGPEEDEKLAKFASKFHAGDTAFFTFNFKAGEGRDGNYVTAYLQEVLVTGKGKRFPTGTSMAERFSKHVGSVSAEDPIGEDDEDTD